MTSIASGFARARSMGLAVWLAAHALLAQADVKVGFSGTMTGPVGILGQEQYDGFMLGLDLLGGRLGGQQTVVLREDDQVKPEIGNQIVRKYLEKDKVDVLVGLGFTNVLLAAAPMLAEAGVPAIATNAGPAALAGAGCKPNIFVLSGQTDGAAEAVGAYLSGKVQRVFLLAPNYQAGRDMLDGFKRHFKGTVAEELYTQLNQPDYSAEISQIQASKADAVFFFYPGGMGINFIKQMHQAGVAARLPMYSVNTVDATTLPALKNQALNVYSGAMWDAALEVPASRRFVAAFEKKYKRTPSLYAATGFDAANLLDAAVRQAGAAVNDHRALTAAIKASAGKFPSVRGSFALNRNNMPIQSLHLFQAVRQADGVTMKQVATPLTAHGDAYAKSCPLS